MTATPCVISASERITALLRRDIESSWAACNPVLKDGETAWISDSDHFVVGDGKSAFVDLPRYMRSQDADPKYNYRPESGAFADLQQQQILRLESFYDDPALVAGEWAGIAKDQHEEISQLEGRLQALESVVERLSSPILPPRPEPGLTVIPGRLYTSKLTGTLCRVTSIGWGGSGDATVHYLEGNEEELKESDLESFMRNWI